MAAPILQKYQIWMINLHRRKLQTKQMKLNQQITKVFSYFFYTCYSNIIVWSICSINDYVFLFILFTDATEDGSLIDWIKNYYGSRLISVRDMRKLISKLTKASELVEQMYASWHDIDDDYMIDLGFFPDD